MLGSDHVCNAVAVFEQGFFAKIIPRVEHSELLLFVFRAWRSHLCLALIDHVKAIRLVAAFNDHRTSRNFLFNESGTNDAQLRQV